MATSKIENLYRTIETNESKVAASRRRFEVVSGIFVVKGMKETIEMPSTRAQSLSGLRDSIRYYQRRSCIEATWFPLRIFLILSFSLRPSR